MATLTPAVRLSQVSFRVSAVVELDDVYLKFPRKVLNYPSRYGVAKVLPLENIIPTKAKSA